MKNFIKIDIQLTSEEESEILIAELSENDFYAFEQDENLLIAYINENDFNEEKVKSLLPGKIIYKISKIKDRNWNHEWEK